VSAVCGPVLDREVSYKGGNLWFMVWSSAFIRLGMWRNRQEAGLE
jgi:hypothetical protein